MVVSCDCAAHRETMPLGRMVSPLGRCGQRRRREISPARSVLDGRCLRRILEGCGRRKCRLAAAKGSPGFARAEASAAENAGATVFAAKSIELCYSRVKFPFGGYNEAI